jgi:hypothetical protein
MPVDALHAWLDALALDAVRAAGRGARAQGGARPRALPRRRGARLPLAAPRHAHAVRRRGAAHRARQLVRLAARRHALRAGRAERGAALARHAAAARAAPPAARRRQHGARRGARPRGHRGRRLHDRDRPGSGEQGGQLGLRRAGERGRREPHRAVPERRALGAAPAERRRLGPRWLTLTGAREHNLKGVDVRIPLGRSRWSRA